MSEKVKKVCNQSGDEKAEISHKIHITVSQKSPSLMLTLIEVKKLSMKNTSNFSISHCQLNHFS